MTDALHILKDGSVQRLSFPTPTIEYPGNRRLIWGTHSFMDK